MIVERIGAATLYCGDSRDVLEDWSHPVTCDAVITDPVWPNCPPGLLRGAVESSGAICGDTPQNEVAK